MTPDAPRTEDPDLTLRCTAIWNGCKCGRAPHDDDRHVWMNTLDHERAVDPAMYPRTEAPDRAFLEALVAEAHARDDIAVSVNVTVLRRFLSATPAPEPYCAECHNHPGRSLHATHDATPTPERLDVERLERAQVAHYEALGYRLHVCVGGCAALVAAEYARLRESGS